MTQCAPLLINGSRGQYVADDTYPNGVRFTALIEKLPKAYRVRVWFKYPNGRVSLNDYDRSSLPAIKHLLHRIHHQGFQLNAITAGEGA